MRVEPVNLFGSVSRILLLLLCASRLAAADAVTVNLDTSKDPEQAAWGEEGQKILKEWYPRVVNLLALGDYTPTATLMLRLEKADKGIAATSSTTITVFSNWIEKRPEDKGLLVHELVHVIQNYPNPNPGWLTEGIADYIRWAIYEGQPLEKFPVPEGTDGYKKAYQMTGGFLLWLESNDAPGIVRRLNKAMRDGTYKDALFAEWTGKDLPTLWKEYVEARQKTSPNPPVAGVEAK
jgi:hypothetical protein